MKGGQGDGFSFLGCLASTYALDSSARCTDLEMSGRGLWAKRIYERKVKKDLSSPEKQRQFNDNIELISEYWSSKVHKGG